MTQQLDLQEEYFNIKSHYYITSTSNKETQNKTSSKTHINDQNTQAVTHISL